MAAGGNVAVSRREGRRSLYPLSSAQKPASTSAEGYVTWTRVIGAVTPAHFKSERPTTSLAPGHQMGATISDD